MNSLVADIVAVMDVCIDVEDYVAARGLCEVEGRVSSECSVVSRKAEGGGSRGVWRKLGVAN